jgi:16S rRNA (guanine527-N7)-methyltransferase
VTDPLDEQLERARELGFLGPGPVTGQRRHAEAFVTAIGDCSLDRCVDLGSGGGVPGLVLALVLPSSHWVLLDAMHRRTAFLAEAVDDLGLGERVEVRTMRAEDAGRDPELRGRNSLVVARGFGPPPVTAECAAPLLRVGGLLVVSEPPEPTGDRWPDAPLRLLGFGPATYVAGPPAFVRLPLESATGDRYPRRSGVPRKRPLW